MTKNRGLLFSFLALGLGIFVLCSTFVSSITRKNEKSVEKVDILKHIDISTCPSLSGALLSELRAIADKNGCSHEGVLRLRIGPSWENMYKKGKASKEELDAVVEFDNAMERLKDSMEKIGSIPSLRKKIKI